MNEGNGSPEIWFITREEFKRRIVLMNRDLLKIVLRYAKLLEKAKTQKEIAWITGQIREIREDIKFNNYLMKKADIEENYLLHWIDEMGNISMRRCTKEEHQETYRKKEVSYIR